MSTGSKIVKAASVVEDRRGALPHPEIETGTVLKRGMLGRGLHAPPPPPGKESLTGELNRLRVEIRQSQGELQELVKQLEAARRQTCEEEQAHRELAARQEELRSINAEDLSEDLIAQAEHTAGQIIEMAKAQAEDILSEAAAKGNVLTEQAKNEGYLEGFARGFEESAAEFRRENEPKAAKIEGILESLSTYWEDTLRQSQGELVTLAMAVAKKILGRAIEENPDVIVEMLRGLVEENKREEYVKITLSPDLAQIDAPAGGEVRTMLEGLGANVSVLTDIRAGAGAVTVETPKGIVDAGLQTQLDNISAAIREG